MSTPQKTKMHKRKHHTPKADTSMLSPDPTTRQPDPPDITELSSNNSKKSIKPKAPSESTLPVSFTDFAVKEDGNYSQMKNNIITQSTRICEILSDATKFGSYYNELTNNIVASMNDMIAMYVKAGRKAVLVDIYEALVEQTDWNNLKDRFKNDVGGNTPLQIPKYTAISTDLKRYKIDKYDSDVLVDMYSYMDEDTVKQFAKSQDEATQNLYTLVDDVTTFENNLCAYRTKTIETMKANMEVLYKLHVNYAKAIVAGNAKIPDTVTINGKAIKFQKAQKAFILDALKTILLG